MITITAASMLYAQGFKLSPDERKVLTASADRDRAEFGESGPQPVEVPVRDFHGALIGSMRYML